MEILNWITAPLAYEFMTKALLVSMLVGIVCSTLSCYMILKGWSLLGDAVSHSVLPGVVLSYILGIPFAIGAFVFGLGSVIAIGYIKTKTRLKEDAVIGIVFTALFALGVVLISKTPSAIDLMHVLFGYVLGISNADAIQTLVIGVITIALTLIFRKDLLLYCFDPKHARSIGINTTALHYLFLVLLALTTVTAIQTVGIILVIAMLITPGSLAYLLTDRFEHMLAIAVASGVLSCVIGTYASYYLDVSTGGAIVVTQAILFGFALFLAPKYGIMKRR
jgi:manganese transport system permease protein